jgi:hypothetical protein
MSQHNPALDKALYGLAAELLTRKNEKSSISRKIMGPQVTS